MGALLAARWLGVSLLVAAAAYYLVLASPRVAGAMVLAGALLVVGGFSGPRTRAPGRRSP